MFVVRVGLLVFQGRKPPKTWRGEQLFPVCVASWIRDADGACFRSAVVGARILQKLLHVYPGRGPWPALSLSPRRGELPLPSLSSRLVTSPGTRTAFTCACVSGLSTGPRRSVWSAYLVSTDHLSAEFRPVPPTLRPCYSREFALRLGQAIPQRRARAPKVAIGSHVLSDGRSV